MGVLFALASALCYGLSDFAGGLLSRRHSFLAVALTGQLAGLLLTLATAPLLSTTAPAGADLGWGALSGVGTGLGMMFLFRGLSQGAMSVVVPVSAVSGIALPVLVGVVALGDRPSLASWIGIAAAVPALWLVSGGRNAAASTDSVVNGLIASGGIAVQYLALAQAGPDSGTWPVAIGRVSAVLAIVAVASVIHAPLPAKMPLRPTLGAAITGGSAALALVCYLMATRHELTVIAVVLSSLYPVLPVLLGITALRERLSRPQIAGLVGAGMATVLISIS